jgi:hypothetical protein
MRVTGSSAESRYPQEIRPPLQGNSATEGSSMCSGTQSYEDGALWTIDALNKYSTSDDPDCEQLVTDLLAIIRYLLKESGHAS